MEVLKRPSKLYSISRVLLFYILSIAVFATVSGLTKTLPYPDHISILLSTVLTLVMVVVFSKWEKLHLKEIGIAIQKTSFQRLFIGFGIGVLLVVVQATIASTFAEIKFSLSTDISVLSLIPSIILYFIVALREELVFRSFALRSLANSSNPIFALILITIIFILEHIISGMSWKMAVIGSGFGGILFGLAALKTKGLALPIGLHFSWNFTQWILGFKDDTGVWKEVVEKGHEANAENVALTGFVIAMIIGISSILMIYKNQKI